MNLRALSLHPACICLSIKRLHTTVIQLMKPRMKHGLYQMPTSIGANTETQSTTRFTRPVDQSHFDFHSPILNPPLTPGTRRFASNPWRRFAQRRTDDDEGVGCEEDEEDEEGEEEGKADVGRRDQRRFGSKGLARE